MPRDVLTMVQLGERELGQQLISHPAVDRVILTGGYETAELFRSFRKDLPLLAETSGKNAIIVTPSADLDLAAKDVAYSAFGHAGQKCSAASLVILVGSVANSKRFHNQLIDAVTSLKVGYPEDPASQMGPIIEPANGKLLNALTTLGQGENWAVEPRQLDETGRLWSPGVRYGVRRGSYFHLTEFFGPVLGVMTADTLEDAIAIQNQVEYGLTAGLHSLSTEEVGLWLETIQAGNLYVNRGITGAIVQRQPFGGWKKSAVGAGTKAGGPNYLAGLGDWESKASTAAGASAAVTNPGVRRLVGAAKGSLDAPAFESLQRALASDALAWAEEFGTAKDVSGLSAERNIFRYRSLPVTVRLSADEPVAALVRTVAAGVLAGSALTVSTAVELPAPLQAALAALDITVTVEDDAAWLASAARLADGGQAVRRTDPAPGRRRDGAGRSHRRAPGPGHLRPPGHRGRPRGAAAVPARAGRQHHRPPLRNAQPPLGQPDLRAQFGSLTHDGVRPKAIAAGGHPRVPAGGDSYLSRWSVRLGERQGVAASPNTSRAAPTRLGPSVPRNLRSRCRSR